jgi:hypothetical protein
MKKSLSIIAVLFCLSASAQKLDTIKGAIIIQPVVVNAFQKDTAFQITWSVFDLTREEGRGCNTIITAFDRTGKKVFVDNCPIPWDIVKIWGTSDSVIDDYILTKFGLKKK